MAIKTGGIANPLNIQWHH